MNLLGILINAKITCYMGQHPPKYAVRNPSQSANVRKYPINVLLGKRHQYLLRNTFNEHSESMVLLSELPSGGKIKYEMSSES